jgi:D-alanyl-lipoteichoic acid acyltransferase DltB (MBOAT superfamily)
MNRLYDIFAFNEQKPLIFTQLDFWLFFIAVMILFSFTHKNYLIRSFYLTVVSLFFYFKTSGLYVILLGVSLVVNYFLGKGIHVAPTDRRKKLFIVLSVLFNVLTLAYFKYAYFFTDSFNALFQTDFQVVNQLAYWANGVVGEKYFVEKIILPVGVSFFTFQSISYVVDIYRKEIEPVKNFFDYTFFVTFFPQLVAGPIVRARDFIPQIRQPHQLDKRDFSDAVLQITKGLIKKIVLADYIAVHFIDKIVDAPESYPGFVSVLAMWGYSLQIYGDFSGYTDIAIGLSRLMGFKLLENFNSPYKAVSVADFWRRWHKSLGSWLRDYLYIPLGGNKGGGVGTYIATLIIFTFLIFITRWYELIYVYL